MLDASADECAASLPIAASLLPVEATGDEGPPLLLADGRRGEDGLEGGSELLPALLLLAPSSDTAIDSTLWEPSDERSDIVRISGSACCELSALLSPFVLCSSYS
jgi:hypothetical protein